MPDKPIIFSAPMVQALLAGRKSQTRRLLSPQPAGRPELYAPISDEDPYWAVFDRDEIATRLRVPYSPGDRLYVREAFNAFQFSQDGDNAWPVTVPTLEECKEADELGYRYGAPQIIYRESDRARKWFADQEWRPSIYMPRWASRLTLTVTEVRVQRLQEISEADAIAEGIEQARSGRFYDPTVSRGTAAHLGGMFYGAKPAYEVLWNSLHGPDAWGENPWVVAVSFTVQHGNIDVVLNA